MIFDSHAHYDDKAFDDDRGQILDDLPKKGISEVINAGTNIITSKFSIELSKQYSYIYAAVGIHPECVKYGIDKAVVMLKNMAKEEKVIAIGEIGLDYHYGIENKNMQIDFFENQLFLANNLDLPVLVHDREAHQDTLNLLKKYKPKGVIHCFSGSVEMAREILDLGMFIGVGGAVTFKNARKIVDVVKEIPIESILLETDAPYMAPVPFRGQRCDSSHIEFTARKIADIKGRPYDEILIKTRENALNLFNIGGI